jgi:hypothetical protein
MGFWGEKTAAAKRRRAFFFKNASRLCVSAVKKTVSNSKIFPKIALYIKEKIPLFPKKVL